MALALVSERLIAAMRPRFEVDGRPEPRLDADLIRLEASEDEDGMARLDAVFLNWGRAHERAEPGLVYDDGQVLDLGRQITVHAGADDNEAAIFTGVIMALRGAFPELRPPEVVVCAEDRLQWLRMRQRSRFFENRSDAGFARTIAQEHGLQADVQADGPSYPELLQVNQSDLGFLRERARTVDARIALDGNALVFRPRREMPGKPVRLTREGALLAFEGAADLAHQRREVRVHGYSFADKRSIHGTAGSAVVDAEKDGPGQSGPEVLAALDVDAIEDLHLEAPVLADEATALAEATMRHRARRFVTGRGITNGTPGMRVGTRVEIVDLGPRFSGIYHVAQVRHCYDQRDGLRTHFRAERVVLGDAA